MKKIKRFNDLINSDKPVLVDFYTEWCTPCKQVPVILKLAQTENKCAFRIVKVDVEKFPIIAHTYNVQNVPTLMVFRKGTPVWIKLGIPGVAEIKELVTFFGHNEISVSE